MSDSYTPAGYWDSRYLKGGDSGAGSRGDTGRDKALFVNDVIQRHGISSVIDWGCGDGQVLTHMTHAIGYLGIDVSQVVLDRVRGEHPSRLFCLPEEAEGVTADLALSMDVLFHFPDDADYFAYLQNLFRSADHMVLIYATDYDGGQTARHVRRRNFTPDITRRYPAWRLVEKAPGVTEDGAEFFLYGNDGG